MSRLTDDQISDIRARTSIEGVAGVKLRKVGRKLVGPCPICGGSERSGRFEVDGEGWVCAVCHEGGDVIKLVQKMHGLDFRAAVDHLGGATNMIDPEIAARRERERAEERAKQEAASARYREDERARLYRWWREGAHWRGTPVEDYLALRMGFAVPDGLDLRLRFRPAQKFHADGGRRSPVLHTGPVMLAAFTDERGIFQGLHMTWLDLSQPKGKARIPDPEAPGEYLNPKKMRGSKAGCEIVLRSVRHARTVIAAEGIENAVLPLVALHAAGADLGETKISVAGDLGNLGGRATESLTHPTLTKADKAGRMRPVKVPGPVPDPDGRAMPVPDECEELVLIKDGDSEPVLTEHALARCVRRNARPGRVIRIADPGVGFDINDLVREGVAA
ncbi:DUF7146 domain-containing protein [Terrihabitans sp. B22-R8]|uniref:DUF7146 domain-containing protein n=1 Tax=Terrihabitans sp. B22-R8 TaxID=3425128 RepID=UPI00403D3C58